MEDFITRKVVKETGNQLCITFTKDEKEAYKFKKGQIIQIIITKIKETKEK